MKNKIAFFLLLAVSASSIYAQVRINLKGQVLDENNLGLMGVNISVKGSGHGVITGIDGNYELTSVSAKSVLVFSFVGYESQEVLVGNRQRINVHLKPLISELDDVVIVAYGVQKKETLIGALSSVDVEKMTEVPVASVTNLLSGSVPGIASVQTSGQPGKDAATLYIRGVGSLSSASSAPLVLVDGVERDFSQIDPNEIENMSVLKDASATAVFGVRGANGVILITTKRGQSGKPSISFSSMNGVQQPMSYLKQVSSYDYARFWNIKQQMDGKTDPKSYFSREDVEAFRIGSDPIMHPNTDWLDYFFRDVFFQTKNNLSISGGTDDVRYFVSMGYMYQNGVLKSLGSLPYDNNFNMNRYNYRANLDFKLSRSTQLKLGVGGNMVDTREPNTSVKNPYNIVAIWSVPMAGPGIVNGVRTVIPKGTYPTENHDAFESYYGKGYSRSYDMTLNMDLELTQDLGKWVKGLSVSVKGAYDNRFEIIKKREGGTYEYQEVYYKGNLSESGKWQEGTWTDPDFDKTLVYVPVGTETPLTYRESNERERSWYLEGRINYNRTFGDHAIGGLLLYNQSRDYYPSTYRYLPRNYIGYVGRVTYGYRSKYLAEFNAGYNGSENFAPGSKRYGFFPSGSIGWVVTGEDFMDNVHWIDYLKVRASWGQVGNDKGTTRFMYKESIWESENNGYSFGVNNPVYSPSFYYTMPGNTNVTWETATKQNYGIDIQAFRNRLSLSVDYFFEHRKDILLSPEKTPAIIAMDMPNLNLGEVDNQGYEIALGWGERLKSGFRYYANATVSYAHNKIVYMDEVRPKYDYMAKTGGIVDRPTGLYKFNRLYQYDDFINQDGKLILKPELPQPYVKVQPGDCMYEDLNGDHIVNGDDRMATGYSTIPEYIFGLNAGLDYKGFHFDMQWTGATHVDKALYSDYRIPFTNAGTRGLLDYLYEGCWTPENQLGAKYPSPAEVNESWNYDNSTLWLQDSSYLRLKTLTVGYTFTNKPWLKALGAKSLGLMFTGYNLLTLSPMKFMDPEAPAKYSSGSYPLIRVYSFGVNMKF